MSLEKRFLNGYSASFAVILRLALPEISLGHVEGL